MKNIVNIVTVKSNFMILKKQLTTWENVLFFLITVIKMLGNINNSRTYANASESFCAA